MTMAPEYQTKSMLADTRPGLATLIALGVFFGGGALGEGLSLWLAPGSGVVAMLSFLMLPGAFMLSMVAWQGFTLFIGLLHYLRGLRRPPGMSSPARALARKAWLLVPLPIVFATFVGIVAGILGVNGFFTTATIYLATGIAFGLCCYWLGRAGLLPIFDDQ